ncbi:hypothetical protein GUITHDRAFT_112664 [Guillardia theta CCMP2712]|uniref:Uncharacterized protein n=1 Tax=Guillardia theta (strain CCMP2712) TaxID=905079 RepID=L1IY72_GUITC|nr:hypothetical protein GUITHDRAFT_112664 [Guillardia theta CCMP2712]EKX41191.1 hypothetical protein GUITHDRAFT_112664 [Guillardia theta CCMP2712]|eukprot:XP_005828171.1 hypothetical protein GUITHDRAFT_112664 [Guillardia theta CCMP2712]
MVASLALFAPADQRKELLAGSPMSKLDSLALEFAKKGASMPVSSMLKKLDDWHDRPDTLLDVDSDRARTQMLSLANHQGWMGSQLASDSQLCKKADIIISKFDQLLKKLIVEETQVNKTISQTQQEYEAIKSKWLDTESKYRLTEQKEKEAKEGAKFARQEYDKWQTAHKQASSDLEKTTKNNAVDKASLESEKELILEIMKMVGVVSNGLDSCLNICVKNSVLAQQTVGKARLETLANSDLGSQSSEVAKILQEILDEIDNRLKNLETVYNQESDLVKSTNEKMVHWEKQLVSLANAQDKAKSEKLTQSLAREKVAGQLKIAKKNYEEETSAYNLEIQPYQKEITVIKEIKKKIVNHCNGVSQ